MMNFYKMIKNIYGKGITMLDFRVQTFLTVCETLNYTKAAAVLGLTQPAVSQHIHFLEDHYGVKLFHYEKKTLTLTPQGKILRARLLVQKNDDARIHEELQAVFSGKLAIAIGVTMTVGEYAIADPLTALLKNHPDWSIHVVFGNTQKLLGLLQSGAIDFALVEGYYPKEDYAHLTFSRQPFVAVCRTDHRFAVGQVKALGDLPAERIILRELGSGTRDILARSLAAKGIRLSDFKASVEVGNMHTIIALLKNDCGISFLYRIAVAPELASGTLREIPLEDFHMTHNFDFIWEKGSVYSAQIEAICRELTAAREG